MRIHRHILAVAAALLCLLVTTSASGHDLPIERSLVLQVHTSHAELLMVYTEPPGPRTERLLALHDANRNGKIDGAEGALAKRPMLRRAFLGLDIEFPGITTGEKESRIRYKRDRAGGIAVAIYQRIDFITADNELNVEVSLEGASGIPELQLVVEAADSWTLPGEKEEAKILMKPGMKKSFHLERTPTPISDAVPDRDWQPPEATRP